MIEPINKIEPLREDLRKLVPDDYLTTTSFKDGLLLITSKMSGANVCNT